LSRFLILKFILISNKFQLTFCFNKKIFHLDKKKLLVKMSKTEDTGETTSNYLEKVTPKDLVMFSSKTRSVIAQVTCLKIKIMLTCFEIETLFSKE